MDFNVAKISRASCIIVSHQCVIASPMCHCVTNVALCHQCHCVTNVALCHQFVIISPVSHCVTSVSLHHQCGVVSPMLRYVTNLSLYHQCVTNCVTIVSPMCHCVTIVSPLCHQYVYYLCRRRAWRYKVDFSQLHQRKAKLKVRHLKALFLIYVIYIFFYIVNKVT